MTGKRDEKAPTALQLQVVDTEGRNWGTIYCCGKEFSTGSVGFYGNGKIANPANPEARYQAGLTFTLIGSKG